MRVQNVLVLLALVACGKSAPTGAPTATAADAPTAATGASPATPAPAQATAPGELRVTPTEGEIAVGKAAPDFSAPAHDGTSLSLAALKGKSVVVYFYPKDETPGCTKEACAFRDRMKAGVLSGPDVVLIGVSTDSLESHRAFARHHELPFHLISDAKGELAKAYGVPNQGGFLARQTIVIGKDGNVQKIYREVDVSVHDKQIVDDLGAAKP
ncbi:MAG: peroxiredoxin [Myxococcales bacterium]|nr:peroxiredoxin [Myxococcales bacterium]